MWVSISSTYRLTKAADRPRLQLGRSGLASLLTVASSERSIQRKLESVRSEAIQRFVSCLGERFVACLPDACNSPCTVTGVAHSHGEAFHSWLGCRYGPPKPDLLDCPLARILFVPRPSRRCWTRPSWCQQNQRSKATSRMVERKARFAMTKKTAGTDGKQSLLNSILTEIRLEAIKPGRPRRKMDRLVPQQPRGHCPGCLRAWTRRCLNRPDTNN